ncbi:Aste57867_22078 [Aphanomyces stellatus]|uniref:Aste57867_22078 protein n=1 Tax=Aphanomyces stellatus TaxID=120398 RepID=A0A485LKK9_9STRA|nr:hypothetical protein As57867_022009 [Aphanomyces stellatus]VFT98746.1 Aste57867_22078 [Aphanomyces stellatus]
MMEVAHTCECVFDCVFEAIADAWRAVERMDCFGKPSDANLKKRSFEMEILHSEWSVQDDISNWTNQNGEFYLFGLLTYPSHSQPGFMAVTRSTPLVLVCGWVAGSTRAVTKFTPIFHRLGYETAVVPSSISHLYFTPSQIHPDIADTLRASAAASPNRDLVLIPHMLSNGGCISWQAIQHQLVRAGVRFHVPAMLFDSAPYSTSGFHTYSTAIGKSLDTVVDSWQIKFPLVRVLLGGVLRLGWLSVVARWAAVGAPDPIRRITTHLIEHDAAVPKLFLYSDGDHFVSSAEVEGAIAQATALGTPVDTVKFAASPHVMHYVHAPAAYEAAVHAFLVKHVP